MIGRLLTDYHHHAIHLPRTRRVAEALASLAPDGVRSLLDVGCGDGRVAVELAAELAVSEVRGVEVAPRAAAIAVDRYDGRTLPFDNGAFDVVVLSDVLHHTTEPAVLLRDCLRVATRCVLVKDHLAFGAVSKGLLWLMDVVGNHAADVAVPGRYLPLEAWFELAASAGGRIAAFKWPLRIHDLPWRLVTRSELQFAARIENGEGTR